VKEQDVQKLTQQLRINVIAGLKKCSPFNRIVRVCLFDGLNFVGNAHAFLGAKAINEEDPRVFVNKVSSLGTELWFCSFKKIFSSL
jgi:hypothetical protein